MQAPRLRFTRIAAVMALYAMDVGGVELEQAVETACEELEMERRDRRNTVAKVRGVVEKKKEIDKTIEEHAVGYTLDRMAAVDRALLRLGVYELVHGGLPKGVAINEAIEIAKEFSTEESGKFVNGILGKIANNS